jgi:8-amino-7-oxononanoate synthase/dethiobiotin synthase
MSSDLRQSLRDLEALGLMRQLAAAEGVDFTSNDYLGLSKHPEVIAAAQRALHEFGAGAPAARLLRGNLSVHVQAEAAAADWQNTDAALLFPSGYQANLALLSALPRAGDVILSDALNHASLIDGCRLSRARVQIFAHNGLEDLHHHLQVLRTPGTTQSDSTPRIFVVAERVYSMDGDLAPVEEILQLCTEFNAELLLDEAHSAGLYPVLKPHPSLLARIITGGKALGLSGAFICGDHNLIQWLINCGRSFIYTTATPPATAAALQTAIELLQRGMDGVTRVHQNATRLRQHLAAGGLALRGAGPIVPVILGDAQATMTAAQKIRAEGFDVRGIRPPTVPEGSSRIRIVCHAEHTDQQIDALSAAVLEACGHPPQPTASSKLATQGLVVCGTDTDVGKTVLSALCVLHLQKLGHEARYLKPAQTGPDSDTHTVEKLCAVEAGLWPQPIVQLDLPASIDQAARAQKLRVCITDLSHAIRHQLAAYPTAHWVLECAGGLRVPLNESEDQLDLIAELAYPVVLAARSGLGTLNHTLLSVDGLQARSLHLAGIALIGPPHPENLHSLQNHLPDVAMLEIPHFSALNHDTLNDWLDEYGLDTIMTGLSKNSDRVIAATN